MKANQMCFVSLPVSRVRELPRRRRRHPRRAALTAAAFIYIYITYMQTQHTAHTLMHIQHSQLYMCLCVSPIVQNPIRYVYDCAAVSIIHQYQQKVGVVYNCDLCCVCVCMSGYVCVCPSTRLC